MTCIIYQNVKAKANYNLSSNLKNLFYKYKNVIIKNMKKAGFTLIELLVVISIISLLATIVLSSVNEAREKAEWAAFDQELNQIVKAVQIHYQDTGEWPTNIGGQNYIDSLLEELSEKNYYSKTTLIDPSGNDYLTYEGSLINPGNATSCGSWDEDVYYTIYTGAYNDSVQSVLLKDFYYENSLIDGYYCVNIK